MRGWVVVTMLAFLLSMGCTSPGTSVTAAERLAGQLTVSVEGLGVRVRALEADELEAYAASSALGRSLEFVGTGRVAAAVASGEFVQVVALEVEGKPGDGTALAYIRALEEREPADALRTERRQIGDKGVTYVDVRRPPECEVPCMEHLFVYAVADQMFVVVVSDPSLGEAIIRRL